ncbi:lipoprotein-releasing ABC transporter permease subunit LolE [Vibrio sp. SCSIO 43136]|uniref:lipoprotein-releasing ABC transporter permease subunit LolE n=1 Tax=Vibrio sp. SCSIO 43136 TaxID=2819101 RepID=UPI002075ECCA|nr:lipoprotein-releasing ABC transporter permease subunit LolE [Vibrio sp. SCSIO 43136]USD66206.1 lipoprotein-releasing ABC transporter permease subunit LolE [Vibrio sp. SCSIO 43136]
MIKWLSLFIGSRFSRAKSRNKMVSFISLSSTVGIGVGVAVIIIGLSAMNGFERELQQRVLSVVAHGEIEGANQPILEWQQVVNIAQQHPRVVAAAPYVQMTGLIEKGAKLKALQVRGVDKAAEPQVSDLYQFITQDSWKNFAAGNKQVILGQGIAQSVDAKVGDWVTLMLPQQGDGRSVKAPKRVRLQVSGLLTLGGQIDHGVAIIPLQDAQAYAGLDNGVTGISLKTNDVLNASNIVREVGSNFRGFILKSWKQQYGFLYRDIQLVRTIMYLVMVLVIGVATFNIVSTLMMAVKDRAAEIAILKTMGASDGLIARIFIWQGVFSGVTGALLGSLVGYLVAANLTYLMTGLEKAIGHQFLSGDIYFIDFLPSVINPNDIWLVSGTAVTLSLLATLYPAKRASQTHPAQVLSSK